MMNARLLALSGVVAVLLASAPSVAEEFLLYTPKPAAGDQLPSSPDQGVLVKRVTVKRGDTLAKLSRKHIGVSSWFPQVLLFNSIKNPDLIYIGDELLIPVSAGHKTSAEKTAPKKRPAARRPSLQPKAAAGRSIPETRPAFPREQESYQQATKAYQDGHYQKALKLFDRFLRKYPHSGHAADASLYRADCFLRLSGVQ